MNADIAGVKLGMTYQQAKEALVNHFGISDKRMVREECFGESREAGSSKKAIYEDAYTACRVGAQGVDFGCVPDKVLSKFSPYSQCYISKSKEIRGDDFRSELSMPNDKLYDIGFGHNLRSVNKSMTLEWTSEYDNASKTEAVRYLEYNNYMARWFKGEPGVQGIKVSVRFSLVSQTVYYIEYDNESGTTVKDLDPGVIVAKYGVPTTTEGYTWCAKFHRQKSGKILCPDWCEEPHHRKLLSNASCPGASDQAKLGFSPNKRLSLGFRTSHEGRLWENMSKTLRENLK
jgi:hypothetical protein